ncbi:hypothetical protein BZARG_259 [Bizionia argentinensis JUB59]|uniref:DUF4136 domain-containing protein n=1 Tax=Bizionia argentinensis JUB59 TaxID=1046627 RepID=G2E9P8_9FLAO|nr:hypothetical protein [Bizionia argentinensis]EGV44747.1 hypothetical protein BZARG_259 [Bizionia argentinensis JUB59]
MKNTFKLIAILILVFNNSCSSIKVLDAWKSETTNKLEDGNVLVIARTENKQVRTEFEQEIAKQLRDKGVKATESFKDMPSFSHEEKVSEKQLENFKEFLKNEGYNAVVLTILKDYQEQTETTESGGYYAGANHAKPFYAHYYGGFFDYYSNPLSYSTFGDYVPATTSTYVIKTFILETVAYDLTKEEGKQLSAVVTAKIDDPKNVTKNAEEYSRKIIKALTKK